MIEPLPGQGGYAVLPAYHPPPLDQKPGRRNLEMALAWAGRTVSNTRNGMDAPGWSTQPPAPSFQQASSPEPLAGGISDEMLKPVLEGLGNQTNAQEEVTNTWRERQGELTARVLSRNFSPAQNREAAWCEGGGLLSPIHPLPAGSISISTPAVGLLQGEVPHRGRRCQGRRCCPGGAGALLGGAVKPKLSPVPR